MNKGRSAAFRFGGMLPKKDGRVVAVKGVKGSMDKLLAWEVTDRRRCKSENPKRFPWLWSVRLSAHVTAKWMLHSQRTDGVGHVLFVPWLALM